jgi:ABC-type multidrug transport system fused ATPase/permease subunit
LKFLQNFNTYIQQFRDILGDEQKKLPSLLVQFFLISFFEILGIGIIVPFINAVVNPGAEIHFFKWISPFIKIEDRVDQLFIFGILLLLVFITKNVWVVLINRNIFKFSANQQLRLRNKLMYTYQRLPYLVYTQRNSAEYLQSMTKNVGETAGAVQLLLRLLAESITLVAILVFLAYQHTIALILLLVLLGGFALFYFIKFRVVLLDIGKTQTVTGESVLKTVSESMYGFKEICILGAEDSFYNTVAQSGRKHAKANVSMETIKMLPRYVLESIIIAFVVLLSFIVLSFGYTSTHFVSILGAFGVASLRLIPSTYTIMSGLSQLQVYRYPMKLLWEDLQAIQNSTTAVKITKELPKDIRIKKHSFQLLDLQNVSFRYPGMRELILRGINLKIHKGESLGLIGTSGVGKTTFIDMLMGLLEPEEGKIFLDNELLSGKVLHQWRSQIAYIPQQIFIIDDSLKKNVALGVPDEIIDVKKVELALKQSQLFSLLGQLSQGVDTLLGERGIRLSGGQRQRVALARAFYHDREVLIMDEATSALDNETEKEIVSEIQLLKGKKTLIVIAHRFSTIEHCGRILRLERGRFIEENVPDNEIINA